MSFLEGASSGLSTDCIRVATLGNNRDIDPGTVPEDIWAGSDLNILNGIDHKQVQIPNGPVSVEIVSDSLDDTVAGPGLRTAVVQYLDASFISKTIVLTLNGTTPVPLPEPITAINSFVRSTSGTFRGANVGNLSIRTVGGLGATYSYMRAGDGLAKSSLYTVPASSTLFIYGILLSISSDGTSNRYGDFALQMMNSSGVPLKGFTTTVSSSVPYKHSGEGLIVVSVPEKSYSWLTCENVSGVNANSTCGFTGIVVKNSKLVAI